MIRFQSEQTIARSADDVWEYAADILRHPEWMGVLDARVVQGRGTELGARASERIKLGPRTVDVGLEVSASMPGRRIGWRIAGGRPLEGDVAIDLKPLSPKRCRAVWSGSLRMKGVWRLLEPLMASEVRFGEAAELVRLKDNLERASAQASATA